MTEITIHSLIYTSRAVEPFTTDELDALLIDTRAKNQKRGITGMLVYLGDAFMQVLEGGKGDVQHVFYNKISKDRRHTQVDVISEGPLSERKFADWTMAFKKIEDANESRPGGFSEFVEKGFSTELVSQHQAYSAAILRSFVKKFGPFDESWDH